MAESTMVLISRHWKNPVITVGISEEGIKIAMPITDYIQALALELGNPIGIFTRAQLLAALNAAATRVQMGMQEVTSSAMAAHIK